MLDVFATICLLASPDACAERVVQVGAPDCEAAIAAAAPRLEAWRVEHDVSDARCAPSAADPLDVTEVAPGIFVHSGRIEEPTAENAGDVANFAIVVGDSAVAVVDSGGSRAVGERIVETVRSLTDRPIRFLVLTHMHPDHVFGATALADAGAEIVGHEALPQALAARAESYETAFRRLIGPAFTGTETPTPDMLIANGAKLDLGGRTLDVTAWPTAHTPTDVTLRDAATGTLIAGDLVFDRHTPALDGSITGWQAALVRIDEIAPTRVVPGHGAPSVPWPEGGAPMRRYLDVLARETRAAIEEGMSLSEAAETVARSEAERWLLFDLYNPRNATAAFTELEWE